MLLDKAVCDWWKVSQGIRAQSERLFSWLLSLSAFSTMLWLRFTQIFSSFMSGSTEGAWLALLMAWVVGKQSFLIFQFVSRLDKFLLKE